MCIYEKSYNSYTAIIDQADEDIKKCQEAIGYFSGQKQKVDKCKTNMDSMASTIATISNGCAQIKINGKRFDEGNHYPNGSAQDFSKQIGNYKTSLVNLSGAIDDAVTQLEDSKSKASRKRSAAYDSRRWIPKPPCGKCSECKAAAGTSTRTTGTGSGDSGNSGSSGGSGGSGSSGGGGGGGARRTAVTR